MKIKSKELQLWLAGYIVGCTTVLLLDNYKVAPIFIYMTYVLPVIAITLIGIAVTWARHERQRKQNESQISLISRTFTDPSSSDEQV